MLKKKPTTAVGRMKRPPSSMSSAPKPRAMTEPEAGVESDPDVESQIAEVQTMSIVGASFGDGATTHFDGNLMIGGVLIQSASAPAVIATAGPVTYTAAQMLSGLILRDCAGASRSDVTASAQSLADAIPGADAGTTFPLTIRNDSGGAFTITVTAGANATLSGTMTIAQNTSRQFKVVFTSPSAYTLYAVS